tara:strand:- start:1752 stop:2396 length:645 start_codon:yes stop_codon:yes gene_type:complete
MGRMKEEYMQMQEQWYQDIAQMTEQEKFMNGVIDKFGKPNMEKKEQDEQEQLITNKTNLKMKKMKKVEEVTMAKETRKEKLRRLFIENGLSEEDVYKDPRGFATIKREGIDKIVAKQNIQVAYEPIKMEREIDPETQKVRVWVVQRVTASMKTGKGEQDIRNIMTFGEASDDNLVGGGKKFPVAMAEKRGMSRAVLKICGLYAEGIKGEDEMDN